MNSQSKKTQVTSQRLIPNFFSENRNANKNIHPSSDDLKRKFPTSSQTEIEELKQQIFDLQTKCKELSQITQENNHMLLQSKVYKLEQEIKQLRFNNDELTKQNKSLQEIIDNYEFLESLDDDNASQNKVESDSLIRPTKRKKPSKRQTKLKESKQNNFSEDEDGLKIEEGAKVLMRALLKTFPSEFNLRDEETFKSETNVEICQRLIPKLQREVKSAYNLSHEQVEAWLQTFHKSKRSAYLKSNQLNQSNPTQLDNEFNNSQEAESDGSIRSAKQQTKLKADDEELKIEEGAKILMRALIKTFPPEYNLRDEETFKSETNVEICQRLIPKLQREVKSVYNLTYVQVEAWLQTIHKSKRKNYLKANQMEID